MIGDALAVAPARVHQPVVQRVVEAVVTRELAQSQRRAGVRRHLGWVEDEPVALERRAHAVVDVFPEASPQLGAGATLGRVLRVQVERQPGDSRAVSLLHPLGQDLTDPAERSDVVRPDVDRVLGHSGP